ncbi:Response regulator receiver domain-containing protein [Paenibacillus sp. OV219]|nr:Response regulator receiver domain-containing protein [Paenibacillus sp. OV219]
MWILIVEDEVHLAEALSQILMKENYAVDVAHDGQEGLDHALSGIHDLILLDIMLPGIDGISLLKTLRRQGNPAPVILLTAKGEEPDKIAGLDYGADDYVAKPFSTCSGLVY